MADSLTSLQGKWTMSRKLSSDVEPVLEIQGFNVMLRKAVSGAPVYLDVTQKGKDEIKIKQSTTAGIPAVNEEWYLDWQDREQSDSLLGKVRSKSRWTALSEISDAFLTDGIDEGHGDVIQSEVESLDNGWKAEQVWYVKDGKFMRNVKTSKGDQKAETKLVYERQS